MQTSIEKQGKKVVFSKILLWLCSSTTSSEPKTSVASHNSVKLDSLLAIQAVRIKTLPPLKSGELVSSQDWGRIQSQLLQCKWSCICHVLENRKEKDNLDVLSILEMCVADSQLVSGSDALPIIRCATMLVEQVGKLKFIISVSFEPYLLHVVTKHGSNEHSC